MRLNNLPTRLKRRSLLSAAVLVVLPATPSWAATDKPDAAKFIAAPQMVGAVLSPDGLFLAMRTVAKHGRTVLTVLDLNTMAPTVVYGSDEADVGKVVWVNNERLAFDLNDRDKPEGKIDAAPGLFAVNRDGTSLRQLVERQYNFVKRSDDVKLAPWNTFLLGGTSQRRGDEVLVVRPEAYDGKEVGYIKLLRLNTKTGRSESIDGPTHAVEWVADPQGNLRVAVTRQAEKGALLWRDPKTDQWRTLSEFNVYTGESDFKVRHVAADGQLYVTAQRGSDKLAMWLINPATGEWSAKPLVQSPQFDVDAHVLAREDKVLGLRFTIDAEVTQWLDAEMAALQAQIDKVLPRTVNRLSIPWTGDAPWVLIEAFADVQPTLYFLFNRQTRKFTRLGAQRPDIVAKEMAAMEMVRFKARDGMEIPAWLSRPNGLEKQTNLPMVVLVHGGPFAPAPSWRWDAEVQFLTARGYAVLQPQFRGTMGFGAAHFRAGWRQWGKAMQNDLADATRWAIAQGIADPKRVAIAGGSYGGYATLMGLLRDPDLFRCGVAWVGVTDLDLLYSVNWSDMSDSWKLHGMPALVGDRVKDAAELKENSPLTHAAEIKQPMLLAYGSADRRVPLVHGQAFRKAVGAGNAQLEWVVYDDEGHGWRAPASQIDFWNRTVRFLDKQLAAS